MVRKLFTTTVVVLTIFWAVGLAAFVPTAQAVTLNSGDLIKASLPAVYYYGADGKRYVFPDEKTYSTWYSDFSGVITVTDQELAAITIGGNATYKPGVKLIKITTDPKVYAVDANGTLRWVTTEAVAVCLYGDAWGTLVQDVPDPFFVNYTIGGQLADCSDFDPATATATATSINVDKGLASEGDPDGIGALSASLASDTPSAQSIPAGSADVIFTRVKLMAGSSDVTITGAVVERGGLSVDADINVIKVYVDGVQEGLSQTLSSQHKATLNGLNITIPANSSVILAIGADVNTLLLGAVVGDEIALKLVGLTTSAATISGTPVMGNTMTVSGVAIGTATILQGSSTVPATIDPDVVDYKINSFKIQAGSEDVTVTQVSAYQASASSVADADVLEVTLTNEKTGQSFAPQPLVNGKVVFNNIDVIVPQGTTVEFSFAITLLGGSGRMVGLDFSDGTNFSIMIEGNTYGFGITPIGGGAGCWALSTVSCGVAVINQGTLNINKGTSPATGNIPLGGESVPIASFEFSARGEDIQVRTMAITVTTTEVLAAAQASLGTTGLINIVLVDPNGAIVAGPKAGSLVGPGGVGGVGPNPGFVTAELFNFTDTFTVPIGDSVYTLQANISAAAIPGTAVVSTMAPAATTAKGETSGKWVVTPPPTALITGNVQTILGPALTVNNDLTPLASTFVAGDQNVVLAYLTLDATAGGEDVKVASLMITDIGGGAGNGDLVNFEMWGDPDNTDDVIEDVRLETSNDTSSGLIAANNFGFKDPLRVSRTAQLQIRLVADVQTALGGHQFQVSVPASVNASGWSTGATPGVLVFGVGQVHTVVANGYFTITQSADIPSSVQMASSTTGNAIMKYKLSAVNEAVDVIQFMIAETQGGSTANISKVFVWLGTDLIGSTTGYTFTPGPATLTVSLASGTLVVPKDGDVEVTITYDIADSATVASNSLLGGAFNLEAGVYGGGAAANYLTVYAAGQASGVCFGDNDAVALNVSGSTLGCDSGLTVNSTNQGPGASPWLGVVSQSSLFSAHKGVLTVSMHGSSPSGLKTPSSNLEVLYITLTASGDDVTIMDMDLVASGVDSVLGITGDWALKSWDKSTTYADGIGDGSLTPGSIIDIANAGNNFPYAPGVLPISITKGTSKTLILEYDAQGAVTNDSIQIHLSAGPATQNGIEWQDTSATLIETTASGDVKTTGLPLDGGAITF